MAITLDTRINESFRKNYESSPDTGQTDTNEVIYALNPSKRYVVEAVVTSAGTATMKISVRGQLSASFTDFVSAYDGTQSANFSRVVEGCSAVGLDIASGTWDVRVRLAN